MVNPRQKWYTVSMRKSETEWVKGKWQMVKTIQAEAKVEALHLAMPGVANCFAVLNHVKGIFINPHNTLVEYHVTESDKGKKEGKVFYPKKCYINYK